MTLIDPAPWRDAATPAVHEQFLELVYDDDQLLAAEFEEIVARAWDGPQPPSPGTPAGPTAERWERYQLPASRPRLRARPRHPGADGWARQRGPPPDARTTRSPGR